MPIPNLKIDGNNIKIKIKNEWIIPEFKDYSNISIVGKPGANGVVVKATHNITGREDAIKIWIPRSNSMDGVVREEQYFSEIRKITSLRNKNIVTIYGAWINNGCYYCSMEYVNGITLREWLEKEWNYQERINMLIKIFTVINYYQSKGVIHGDIHDRNIMIDKDEDVHIIDFGTSVISNYEHQSIDRENFLMYELVEKLLGSAFSDKSFLVKKYAIRGEKGKGDVRNAKPVLFSASVLEYGELLKLKRDIGKLSILQDLPEVCERIAKGLYINIDYFYLNMKLWCSEDIINRFPEVFSEILEEVIYGDADNNDNEAEKLLFVSLYVYYEKYKMFQDDIIERGLLNQLLPEHYKKELMEVVNKNDNLIEGHRELTKKYKDEVDVYEKENDLRRMLHIILSEYFGGYYLHIIREEYLRMEELKLDDDLYNQIICLSYNYRFNNGIVVH